jgi:hypothetical protein
MPADRNSRRQILTDRPMVGGSCAFVSQTGIGPQRKALHHIIATEHKDSNARFGVGVVEGDKQMGSPRPRAAGRIGIVAIVDFD